VWAVPTATACFTALSSAQKGNASALRAKVVELSRAD
jgi:hypothetical protein